MSGPQPTFDSARWPYSGRIARYDWTPPGWHSRPRNWRRHPGGNRHPLARGFRRRRRSNRRPGWSAHCRRSRPTSSPASAASLSIAMHSGDSPSRPTSSSKTPCPAPSPISASPRSDLREANPSLVIVSLTPFGVDGPLRDLPLDECGFLRDGRHHVAHR